MTLGQKIKRIRTFRNLTQKQLGVLLGYTESNADVRIRQYEQDDKAPRKENLMRFAEVLGVNYVSLTGGEAGSTEYIMQTLFWLEEATPGLINIIQLEKIPRKNGVKKNPDHRENDMSVKYYDGDDWPTYLPACIWFKQNSLNQFIADWRAQKKAVIAGKITQDEYFEWKLNWPNYGTEGGNNNA
ncbi:MAG: helix-turn-helix domain-containing protein [Defluviitaleaceae bacterium]|nr:helix-turn-helix domain-containing protein [Defluviitaleaceae bacterium]